MSLRLLIAGGGTGGHLYPGVALADELRRRDPSSAILFVGTQRGIESRVIPRLDYELETIDQRGIKGGGLAGAARGAFQVPRAMLQSRKIIRRFRPDVVVGVGGYSSGPVVLTAALSRRPTAILEQNTIPGITNRILGRFVRAALVNFEASRAYFPSRKVRVIGNPIRRALTDAAAVDAAAVDAAAVNAAAEAGRSRGADPSLLRLLVLGGSQGARPLNESVPAGLQVAAARLAPRRLKVLHQSGAADEEAVRARYADLGFEADVRAFIDDMAAVYAQCDLAVCRAGATTLAELTAVGLPSILIPFPHAADDHQTHNARAVQQAGGAVVLPQSELTPERLAGELTSLAEDFEKIGQMAELARSIGKPAAAAAAVDICFELAGRRPPDAEEMTDVPRR